VIYLRSSVGIEIRREDLHISCLRSNLAGGVFTSFARVAGYRQREQEIVRGEIDAFFKREKVSRDNIVLGLPHRDIILRSLELPREVEDNLRQVVMYQVQSFEPTEEEKLYYDFFRLKNGQAGKKLQVLVIMIRKSILDVHLETLRQLGIRPAIVIPGTLALANMFLGTQADGRGKIFVLSDCSQAGMELAVLRDRMLLYAREVDRREGMPWKQLLLRELETAAGKLRLPPDETIESIVISGEESEGALLDMQEEIPGCQLIGDRLRFEIAPQNRVNLQEAATSLGLAYAGITRRLPIKFNLLPFDLRVHQKRWAYIPTIILGLAIVAGLAGLGFRRMVQERILIRELDQQIQSLNPAVERARAVRAQAESLEKQVASVEDLLARRDWNLEILQELTELLPADTYLRTYRNANGALTLLGDSPSPPDLVAKLENSPLLKDVVQVGAVTRSAQTGKDQFQITAKSER
jgi:Tfp pilus assembly protein PilN